MAGLAVVAGAGIAAFLPSISAPPPGLRQRFVVLVQPWMLAWGAAGALGNTLVGWLLDRRRRPGLLLGVVIVILAAALYAIPAVATNAAGVVVLLLLWGGTAWSLQVPLQYQLTKTFPEHAATTVALLASSVYLGSALGSVLDGALLSATAPKYLPLAAGSIAVLAFIVNAVTTRGGQHTDAEAPAAAPAGAGGNRPR